MKIPIVPRRMHARQEQTMVSPTRVTHTSKLPRGRVVVDATQPNAARGVGASTGAWLFPSWLISLVLHGAVATSLVLWVQSQTSEPVGFADGSSRELGLVPSSEGTEVTFNAGSAGPDAPVQDANVQESSAQTPDTPSAVSESTEQVASVEPIAVPVTVKLTKPGMNSSPVTPLPFPVSSTGASAAFPGTGTSDATGLIRNAIKGGAHQGHAGAIPGASFLGARDNGTRIVFAIDCSASMANYNAMRSAKAALVSSLQSLSDAQQFQIIFYNQQPRMLTLRGSQGDLMLATEVNKSLARQQIGGVVPDLGTDHLPALRMALRLGPEVLFFLTDADEPQLSAAELAEIQRLNQGRTRIHTIEFGIGGEVDADNFLKKLARQNDGTYRYHDVKRLSSTTDGV